ncbi:MAG: glycosyltransferase, partial [Terriglobia bacterium]
MNFMVPSEPGAVALSLVIPVYNEAENIAPLAGRLRSALSGFAGRIEIIVVDDGSTDETLSELRSAQQSDALIRILHFAKNLGQTAAIAAGFHYS